MEKIKIVFLGTSSAVPTETRNHTGIWFSYKNENILIDCGEGTQRQFRKAKINPCKITRLLITHLHGDHVFGIPGLFGTLNLNDYQKTLEVYGPKGIKKFIKNLFRTFALTKTMKIKVNVHEVRDKVFETSDFKVVASSLEHGIPTLGYVFLERSRLKIDKRKLRNLKISRKDFKKLGNLVRGKNVRINGRVIKAKDLTYVERGRKVSVIIDTKLVPNVKKLAKDSDLAIIESTFLDETGDRIEGYKHMTAKQVAKVAKEGNVKKLLLTHLSQRNEFKANELVKEAKKYFKNVEVAKDLMVVEL